MELLQTAIKDFGFDQLVDIKNNVILNYFIL